MELITYDDEIKEVLITDLVKSDDHGKVIVPSRKEYTKPSLIEKEIIANDALDNGSIVAGKVHGVDSTTACDYTRGEGIGDADVRARILDKKHNIADVAVSKLMETLNLFDPTCIEKHVDIVKSASALANIVERVSVGSKGNGNEVHLHLYGPKQNSLDKYTVIDV